ncbi:MAG: TlpA disulfide reductase family protein [Phototrophicaceae bacterium]
MTAKQRVPMTLSPVKKWLLIVIAATSSVVAMMLLFWAGLPKQADYIGYEVDGIGYVAPTIDEIAPPFEATTLANDSINLINLRGESLIINFWATWCAPCAIEMPELQTLYEETGIGILGINIGESPELIADWVTQYGLTFDIVLDPQQTIYAQYRLIGQPTTYILNPDGIITHIFYGSTTADALQRAIETH